MDRRALPTPDNARPGLETTFVAPRTVVEDVLAGIWAEVLDIETIGVHDNFFELGGHSLLATQVLSRLRETFQVELPLHTLFEATTVAELAKVAIAHETKPGQTEKIARICQKLKAISTEEMKEMLKQKKRERGVA